MTAVETLTVASPVLQRARGTAATSVAPVNGRTRLRRLHQAGCLKLRFPRQGRPDLEAVLINTAGGLAGGDHLDQTFDVGEKSTLSVTTQACERVYRSQGADAKVETGIRLAREACFHYLPQETILFDGGRLRRTLEMDCAASSRFLIVESVVLGREAMGEVVRAGRFSDRWRIRRDGRLIFADDLHLSGDIADLTASNSSLDGGRAFATFLWQAPDGGVDLGELRDILGEEGGVSLVAGLGIARLVAADGYALRARLIPALNLLAHGPLPRVWSL